MPQFPSSIFAPRAKENKPYVEYDPTKVKTIFAEDFSDVEGEVVEIEKTLLNTDDKKLPYGLKIGDIDSFLAFLSKCKIDFAVLDEQGNRIKGGSVSLDPDTGVFSFGTDEMVFKIELQTIGGVERPVLVPYLNGVPFGNAVQGNITIVANPNDHYAQFQFANNDGTIGPVIAYNEEANSVNFAGNVVLYNFQGAGLAVATENGGYLFLTKDYSVQAQMVYDAVQNICSFQYFESEPGLAGVWKFLEKCGFGKVPTEQIDSIGKIRSDVGFNVNGTDGVTQTITLQTDIRNNGFNYQKKTRDITFTGGIVTSISDETDWIDI